MLVYTRIPNETAPEAFWLASHDATVADLLDQVGRARSARGRSVRLATGEVPGMTPLAELGIGDGDLVEVTVNGEPKPGKAPDPDDQPIDFAAMIVPPEKGSKRLSEYEAVTQLLQWSAPYHIDGRRPSQKVWDAATTALRSSDWEAYRAPDRLYYRTYVGKQAKADRAVSTAFRFAQEAGQLAGVDPEHLALMRQVLGPLQYPDWGLCVIHQHVTRFAMSSWIAGATQFMMFDELRHAQLYGRLALAYGEAHGGFDEPRPLWLAEPRFQGVRQLVEEAMAVLDWGQSLVVAGLAVEPVLTAAFHAVIAADAGRRGDSLTPFVCQSIRDDKLVHRNGVLAFAAMLADDAAHGPANAELMRQWLHEWQPRAVAAAAAFAAGSPAAQAAIDAAAQRAAAELDTVISPSLEDAS